MRPEDAVPRCRLQQDVCTPSGCRRARSRPDRLPGRARGRLASPSTTTSTTRPPADKAPTTTSGPSTTTTHDRPEDRPAAARVLAAARPRVAAPRRSATRPIRTSRPTAASCPATGRNEQVVERNVARAAAPARPRCEARVRQTQHELDVAHADIQAAAVEAYMNSGSSRLEAAITAIASASSAMDASRTMHLIGSFGDQQNELIQQYLALQKRLTVEQQAGLGAQARRRRAARRTRSRRSRATRPRSRTRTFASPRR